MLRIVTLNTQKSEITDSNEQLRYLNEAFKKWNRKNSVPKVPDSHICIIEFYQSLMKNIIIFLFKFLKLEKEGKLKLFLYKSMVSLITKTDKYTKTIITITKLLK